MKLRTVGKITWTTFLVCIGLWQDRNRAKRERRKELKRLERMA
ncbi:MAG TPA: hypothetical protein VM782_01120 [Stellaceae bacterium]|nr:hypothetical protein [Stellaceae bacterium]